MTFEQWAAQIDRMHVMADRSAGMRTERARKVARAAGLDPAMPFLHAHNALCSLAAGRPWPGVDYSKVREVKRIERHLYDAHRIVDRWSTRVWPTLERKVA